MRGLLDDLTWRGLVHQTTDPDLAGLLDGDDPLTVYNGFDPTAASLTLGNFQQIVMLMRLQRGGHRPIALAGGGTGLIGDPSFKAEERNLLSAEQLDANLSGIRRQLERFLDFTPAAGPIQAVLLNNGDWLGSVSLLDFLRVVGKHFTVNAMIAKESVKARLTEREQGISFMEFTYMLLQAFDFLHLYDHHGCRLQLGGSDQWGNITMGIDLIRRTRGAVVYGLTSPLVVRADGVKFGKSEGENIWLDPALTSPYAMFQFLLGSEDAMVGNYLRRFTFLDHAEVEGLEQATLERAERREAQRTLARVVTTMVHGPAEAERAEQAARVLFSEEIASLDEPTLLTVFAEAPSTVFPRSSLDPGLDIVGALVRTGMEKSNGAARRAMEQGGVAVNNRKAVSIDAVITRADLLHDRYVILQKGKRNRHLLRFE